MANLGTLGIPGSELVGLPAPQSGGWFISMWSGATTAVPLGWQLCDGTGGVPDLRDKFIVGAGSTYAVGATGGATTFTPTGTNSAPTVTGTTGTDSSFTGALAGADFNAAVHLHTHDFSATPSAATFTGDDASSLPPYYALCFIAYVGSGSV